MLKPVMYCFGGVVSISMSTLKIFALGQCDAELRIVESANSV